MPVAPSRVVNRVLWVTIAIVFLGLAMRAPIVAVAPIVHDIQADLGLTAATVALLTSIPVLCFALATPFAVWLTSRGGTPFALSSGIILIVVGVLLRSSAGVPTLFVGTALLGVGIALGNVLVPVVIRREYGDRGRRIMTPVYTSVMNVGAALATVLPAPIETRLGWRTALVIWCFTAIVALAVILGLNGWRRAVLPNRMAADPIPVEGPPPSMLRDPVTWMLAAAFAGQSFSYYATSAWLPTLLSDEVGVSPTASGAMSSIFQIFAVGGAFLVPLIASRLRDVAAIVVVGILWVTVPIGLIVAPQLWVIWTVAGGIAQGGGFTAIVILVVIVARSDRHASQLSGITQGVAYALAAAGPFVLGAVHDLSGGWTAPMLIVVGSTSVYLVLGTLAGIRVSRRAG